MKILLITTFLLLIIAFSANAQVQDQSDKTLSIIVPKAIAVDIDFGKVLKNSVKDSVFSGYIKNTGKPAIRIDKIEIKGKDAVDFTILTNIFPFTIQQGNSKNIEFRFKPKSTGIKTARVIIVTQTDTLTNNIRGECVEPKIEVITEVVDFGKIAIHSQSDKTIESAIKNIGSSPLKINSIEIADKDESQFSIIEVIKSYEIKSGENKSVKVRFNPDKVGRTSGKIKVNYENGTEPAVIQLYGEGLPVYATIKGTVKDAAGKPLEASIGWELMSENFKNIELGKIQSSVTDGSFEFKVPIGANYAYYFTKQGYSGVSDNALLKDKKKELTLTKDVILKKPWDGSITVNNIFFEFNKSDLRPESFTELERLAELLKEYPETKVEISGHTDNIGDDSYNQKLSQDRAGSVVNYLIRKGIKNENLIAKGYGKTKPVADNSTGEGRAKNRRVEFKFLK